MLQEFQDEVLPRFHQNQRFVSIVQQVPSPVLAVVRLVAHRSRPNRLVELVQVQGRLQHPNRQNRSQVPSPWKRFDEQEFQETRMLSKLSLHQLSLIHI